MPLNAELKCKKDFFLYIYIKIHLGDPPWPMLLLRLLCDYHITNYPKKITPQCKSYEERRLASCNSYINWCISYYKTTTKKIMCQAQYVYSYWGAWEFLYILHEAEWKNQQQQQHLQTAIHLALFLFKCFFFFLNETLNECSSSTIHFSSIEQRLYIGEV